MAFSVTSIGTNSNAFGSTVSVTVGAGGVPAGALIIAIVDEVNPGGTGTITDSAANGYQIFGLDSPNNNTTLGLVQLYFAANNKALVSGNTITFTKNVSGADILNFPRRPRS